MAATATKTDDFKTARDIAHLGPHDLANILKINRCTVSFWFNGHSSPHRLLRPKVDKVLAAVDAAVQAGDLPVPYDVKRRERGHYLQQIVVKHLRALATS